MKYTILVCCYLLSAAVWSQSDRYTFYFDYKIEYTYTSPGAPSGQIIVYYNSLDKYAAYTYISRFMEGDSRLITFLDGSALQVNEMENRWEGQIYPATLSDRNTTEVLQTAFANLPPEWKATGRNVDIAGYEAEEYTATFKDDSQRKIWISKDAFDARTLHTPSIPGTRMLPLTLTEATFLNPGLFLMGSEIELDGGYRYSLMVTYLEHEFHRMTFENLQPVSASVDKSMATSYHAHHSKLREAQFEVWMVYDRMNGLEYIPRTYDFDRHARYVWIGEPTLEHPNGSRQYMDIYFNSDFEFAAISSPSFSDDLEWILTFKNGAIIAYYGPEDQREAIFIDPVSDHHHLDHPEKLIWHQFTFDQLWKATEFQSNVKGWISREWTLKGFDGLDDKLFLHEVNFDPRVAFQDIGNYVGGYSPIFEGAESIPSHRLITRYSRMTKNDRKQTIELEEWRSDIQFLFSDEAVQKFYRLVRQ
jgi:hypothetical protein